MSTTVAAIHPEEQPKKERPKQKIQRPRCRYFNRAGGCNNASCPFLHTAPRNATISNNESKPKNAPKKGNGGKPRLPKNKLPSNDSSPRLNSQEDSTDESLYKREPQCPRTRKIDEKTEPKRATTASETPHTTKLTDDQFSPSNDNAASAPPPATAKKKKQSSSKKSNTKGTRGAKVDGKTYKNGHLSQEQDADGDKENAEHIKEHIDIKSSQKNAAKAGEKNKNPATATAISSSKGTRSSKNIPCRYGDKCRAKKTCKYLHPDSSASTSAQPTNLSANIATGTATTTATGPSTAKKEVKHERSTNQKIGKLKKEDEFHNPTCGFHHPSSNNQNIGTENDENDNPAFNINLSEEHTNNKKEVKKEKTIRKKNKKCRYGEKCRDESCAFQHPPANNRTSTANPKEATKKSASRDTVPFKPSDRSNKSNTQSKSSVPVAVHPIPQETKSHHKPQQPQITDSNIDQLLFGEGSNEVWDHLDQQLQHKDEAEQEQHLRQSSSNKNRGKCPQRSKDLQGRKAKRNSVKGKVEDNGASGTRNKARAQLGKGLDGDTKDNISTAKAPSCEETKKIEDNADAIIREAKELEEEFKALSEQNFNNSGGEKKPKLPSKKQAKTTTQHTKHEKENIAKDNNNKKEKIRKEKEEMLKRKLKDQEAKRLKQKEMERKQKELKAKRLKEEEEQRKQQELEAKRAEEERRRAAEALAAEQARKAKEEEEMLKRKQKEEEEKQRREQQELEAKRLEEEELKRQKQELEAKKIKEEEEQKREEAFVAEQAQKAKRLEEQKLARAEKLRKEKEAARLKKAKSDEKRMKKAKQHREDRVRYWENDKKMRKDFAHVMTQFCIAEVKRLDGNADNMDLDSNLMKDIEDEVSKSYNRMNRGNLKVKVTLPSNKQYHNRTGEIIGWDDGKQKYKIGLETKKHNIEHAFLLPENLEPLEDTHSGTAKKRRKSSDAPEDETKLIFNIEQKSFEVSRVLVDKLSLIHKLEPDNLGAKIQQEMAERRRAEEAAKRRREEELKRQREMYEKQMKWEKEMREERLRQEAAAEEQARKERAARKEAKRAARKNPFGSYGYGGGGYPFGSFRSGRGGPTYIHIIGPDGRPAIFVLGDDSDDEDHFDGYFDEDYYDYEEEDDNEPSAEEHAETLGISVDAPMKDIKKAFRQKALKYHPDKHQTHETNMTHGEAEEYFKKCTAAYEFFNNMHHG